jgi:hypothetical protein
MQPALKPIRWSYRLACFALIAASTGCVNLTGHWIGSDLKPEMARDQFQFLRGGEQTDNFVNTDLRLQQDGSYTAVTNYGGTLHNNTGTWKYDDKGYVTFSDSQGHSYVYAAKKIDDNTLLIIRGIKGTDVTLTLKKAP